MSAALQLAYPDEANSSQPASTRESLLHFLTCGSVDDGKSTLLGRLLFDSNAVLDDQLSALDRDSLRFGTQGQARDFALLVDGLSAEREQGITIDVAYRYFATSRRSFIVADTPGHEQYTRNMATGASTAELAIILVDARKGILPQTRRHSYIVSMLGVRNVVLAVNKMDLVGFSAEAYHRLTEEYRRAVASLGFASIVSIPICARDGDNVASASQRTPWYQGPVLLDYLETVSVDPHAGRATGFHFPVQLVNRPNLDFRGYAGTVASGEIHVNQAVRILPSGQLSRIESIVTADGSLESVATGQAVTLTLANEVDVSRGDVIVEADSTLAPAMGVTARLLWMATDPVRTGQMFLVKIGAATANACVACIHHVIDIHSFETHSASGLAMNEIAVVDLTFDKPMVSAAYSGDRSLGALILVDRSSNQTVALGVVEAEVNRVRAEDDDVAPLAALAGGRPAWQPVAARILGAAVLWTIVMALAGGWVLATVVALAEILLTPLIGLAMDAAWKQAKVSSAPQGAEIV